MQLSVPLICNVNSADIGAFNTAPNTLPGMEFKPRRAKPNTADIAAARRLKSIWDHARQEDSSLTQEAACGPLGMNQSSVSQYLNGRIPLNYSALLKFAKLLGVEPESIRSDLPEQRISYRIAEERATYSDWVEVGTVQAEGADDINDSAPRVQLRAPALRQQGLRPERLRTAYAEDDAMRPRIQPGDAVVYDPGDTRPRDGLLYALDADGRVLIRRADLLDGVVYFKADEPTTDPQWRKPRRADDRLHPLHILGRVRWIGGWA